MCALLMMMMTYPARMYFTPSIIHNGHIYVTKLIFTFDHISAAHAHAINPLHELITF